MLQGQTLICNKKCQKSSDTLFVSIHLKIDDFKKIFVLPNNFNINQKYSYDDVIILDQSLLRNDIKNFMQFDSFRKVSVSLERTNISNFFFLKKKPEEGSI